MGQFIEGLVFNSPAAVPRLVNHLCAITIQPVAGTPQPLALSGLAAFVATSDSCFLPLFLGAHDAKELAVSLAQMQVFDFPQPHLFFSFLVLKN